MTAMFRNESSDFEATQQRLREFVASLNRQPRILVVEDDEDNRKLLTIQLAYFTEDVTECGDGEEAVAMLLSGQYDLAMIDLSLPKLSGVQVIKRTRDACPNTKFVVVTGRDREFLDEFLNEPGIAIILTKPVTQNDLAQLFGEIRI